MSQVTPALRKCESRTVLTTFRTKLCSFIKAPLVDLYSRQLLNMSQSQQSDASATIVIVIDDNEEVDGADGQLSVNANRDHHSMTNTEPSPTSIVEKSPDITTTSAERIPSTIKQNPIPGSHAQQVGPLRWKPRDRAFWSEQVLIYNPRLDDGVEGTYFSLWMQYAELRGVISQRYHTYQQSEPQKRGKLLE